MTTIETAIIDPRDANPSAQPVNSNLEQQDITNEETDWEENADEETEALEDEIDEEE